MLNLDRREGEKIVLELPNGKTITVKVCAIDRGRVRLGFRAPQDIEIWREEIWIQIQKDEQAEEDEQYER